MLFIFEKKNAKKKLKISMKKISKEKFLHENLLKSNDIMK